MIQRIQTIFLVLAAAGIFSVFALPFATTPEAIPTSQFFVDADYDVQDHVVMLILFVLAGLLTSGAIFLFNNRPLQTKVTLFGLIANILALVATAVLYLKFSSDTGTVDPEDGFGFYLPVAGLIFSFLAMRFIKKDEKLVRSADRLR
jgi:hypothetical protein